MYFSHHGEVNHLSEECVLNFYVDDDEEDSTDDEEFQQQNKYERKNYAWTGLRSGKMSMKKETSIAEWKGNYSSQERLSICVVRSNVGIRIADCVANFSSNSTHIKTTLT